MRAAEEQVYQRQVRAEGGGLRCRYHAWFCWAADGLTLRVRECGVEKLRCAAGGSDRLR